MRAGRLSASLHGDGRATPGDQPTSLGPARRRVRQHALHRMFAEPSSGGEEQMQARMKNPALVLGAMEPVQGLFKAVYAGGVDPATVELVHLRVSQINGCSACVGSGVKAARKAGETEERLATVAAWREAPYFSDAERAALALAEAATRLADRPDPVPDEIWDAAADHFGEKELAAIVLMIGVTNLFNRLNATIRQVAGAWG